MPPFLLNDDDDDITEEFKVFNDPIHGHFKVPQHALDFVDTPHVQRLRDLKQLGATYLVYPGASHNRFEHSLGVSHLAAHFSKDLSTTRYNTPIDSFENTHHFNNSMKFVRIAGLCHDLGHGPFSHLFDHKFLPLFAETTDHPYSQHEARSVMLLQHMIDKYNLDYSKQDIAAISSLITGKRPVNEGAIPKFLYDVVANETCGIDTDRFDYIARDVYNVGLQTAYGFDHERLMEFAKVIDDSICFHRKEVHNVYNLFLTRFQLFRTVYNHKAAIGIDGMMSDILELANSTLKISHSINDPEKFLAMSDTVLHTIEYSTSSDLKAARDLVHRLRRRDLYSFVDETLLPADFIENRHHITAQDITTNQNSGGINLVPDDIKLRIITLNFGMKNKNPVDTVKFFNHRQDVMPVNIASSEISFVLPIVFEEKICRIYLRRSREDPRWSEYMKAAKVAFRNFVRRNNLAPPMNNTSNRSPQHHEVSSSSPTTSDDLSNGDTTTTTSTPDDAETMESRKKRNAARMTNGDALNGSKFTMRF